MLKQAIVVRTDIKMSRGKLATQVAHAAVTAFYNTLNIKREIAEKWLATGQKKVVLKVSSLDDLLMLSKKSEEEGLLIVVIRDAGLTQLEPGTITCIGIGPDYESKIDRVTGNLKLL